jgi:putative flippase GtrA
MWQVARFFCVGAGATIVHVVAALVYNSLGVVPLWANFFAFLTAFIPSYAGNYVWTFDRVAEVSQSLRRFLALSFGCFAINQAIVYGVTEVGQLPLWVALIPVILVIPVAGYFLSKLWAFKPQLRNAA